MSKDVPQSPTRLHVVTLDNGVQVPVQARNVKEAVELAKKESGKK